MPVFRGAKLTLEPAVAAPAGRHKIRRTFPGEQLPIRQVETHDLSRSVNHAPILGGSRLET